ncbi:MAG: N-glycosylase/DNA lyase [Omnitrophica bacterium]|nr:N-glycosylase/DNA lyase [Candidatus Omnitrophota bacterium]
MRELLSEYSKKKHIIKNRLKEFKKVSKNEDIFGELCFCILTPQSKAVHCDKAIRRLKETGLLLKGTESNIKPLLKGLARFHNKKASYLVAARNLFKNKNTLNIKSRLNSDDVFKTREWLVDNVKGLGYKEASHFLRNIGLGRDVAILDVHILKNLQKLGVVETIPSSITRKNYIEIEDKMRSFAKKSHIPLEELDLLFWSGETGFVFK